MMEQQKDYSLLRPFDLDAAKRGVPICYRLDGSKRIYMTGPDKANRLCVEDPADGRFVLAQVDKYCMAPLCWVEGKPVYKGDVLYFLDEARTASHITTDREGDVFLHFNDKTNAWVSGHSTIFSGKVDCTWTPPKVKREVKLLGWFDGDQFFWLRDGAEPQWPSKRVPSEDKVIEIEE